MLPAMIRKLLIVGVPVGHAILFTGYYLWSRDAAGTAMSFIFAIALGLMIYILLPTVRDIGPTAPVDPDWGAVTPVPPLERAERVET